MHIENIFFMTFSHFLAIEKHGARKYRRIYFCPPMVLYRKALSALHHISQQVTRDHSYLHHDLSWGLPQPLAFWWWTVFATDKWQCCGRAAYLSPFPELCQCVACYRLPQKRPSSTDDGWRKTLCLALSLQQCVGTYLNQVSSLKVKVCVPKPHLCVHGYPSKSLKQSH